jgi:hypothetical protein
MKKNFEKAKTQQQKKNKNKSGKKPGLSMKKPKGK